MRTIGSYELIEQWNTEGPVSVHRARSRDGGVVRLRTLQPPPAFSAEVPVALSAVRLRQSASLQAEAGGREHGWSTILDHGRAGNVTYVASDAGGHATAATLGELVEGRYPIDARTLRPLVADVIRALQRYHQQLARPMGSLSERRVIVERADASGLGRALLTDPAAISRPRRLDVSGDVAALGRLLWRVVEKKDENAQVPPTAAASPAWRALGRSGERWRGLVNTLIDPRGLERGSLPDLESVLQALPVEPYDWRKPVATIGGVAAMVGIGAAIWFATRGPTEAEKIQGVEDLRALAVEHRNWLGETRERLWAEGAGLERFAEGNADEVETLDTALAHLTGQVLTPMRELETERQGRQTESIFDPARYGRVEDGDYAALIERLDDVQIGAFKRADVQKGELDRLTDARAAVEAARTNLATWPTLDELDDWVDTYRAQDRGWTNLAGDLDSRVDTFRDTIEAPAYARIEEVLVGALAVEQLERAWAIAEEIHALRDEPGRVGLLNRRTATRLRFRNASTADEALDLVDAEIGALERLLEFAQDSDESVRWDLVAASGEQGELERLTVQGDWSRWTQIVSGYEKLAEDPRRLDEWDAKLADMKGRSDRAADFGATDDSLRIANLRRRAAEAVEEAREAHAIQRNATVLAEASERARQLVEITDQQTEEIYRPLEQPPAEFVAENRELTFENEGLTALWRSRLDGVDAAAFERDRSSYPPFFRATRWLEGAFEQIDDARTFMAPRAAPTVGEGSRFDPGAYTSAVRAHRADEVARLGEQLVSVLDAEGPISSERLEALKRSATDVFAAWEDEAVRLVGEAMWIEARLDEAYRVDEPVANENRAIGAVVAALSNAPASHAGVARSLAGVVARVGEAQRVAGAGSLDAMRTALGGVGAERPAMLAEAWQWLATKANEGEPLATLDEANRVRGMLESWANDVAPPERAQAVRGALISNGPSIWTLAAGRINNQRDLLAAAGRRAVFGVNDSALPGQLWWRVRTLEFVNNDLAGLDDNDIEAKNRTRQFVSEVSARGDLPSSARGSDFLRQAQILSTGDEPKAEPGQLGPAMWAGWTYVDRGAPVNADGLPQTLVYQHADGLELRFQLVPGVGRPVFLSEYEVSVELVQLVLGGMGRNADGRRRRTNVLEDLRDPANSIRTWREASNNRISPAEQWIPPSAMQRDRVDFAGAPPAPPNGQDPMQNIGPHTSMALAQELGCRLPTESEFRAAIAYETGGQTQGANLRRAEWMAQHRHAENVRGLEGPSEGSLQGDGASVWQGDDGTVFFRDVDSQQGGRGTYLHIVGNVAEWVIRDNAQETFNVNPESPRRLAPDLFGPLQSTVGVMGQSALMSRDVPPDGMITVEGGPGGAKLGRRSMKFGYTDVGFRLALAPAGRWGSVRDWLARRVDEAVQMDAG